jgi:hypothetical protein
MKRLTFLLIALFALTSSVFAQFGRDEVSEFFIAKSRIHVPGYVEIHKFTSGDTGRVSYYIYAIDESYSSDGQPLRIMVDGKFYGKLEPYDHFYSYVGSKGTLGTWQVNCFYRLTDKFLKEVLLSDKEILIDFISTRGESR